MAARRPQLGAARDRPLGLGRDAAAGDSLHRGALDHPGHGRHRRAGAAVTLGRVADRRQRAHRGAGQPAPLPAAAALGDGLAVRPVHGFGFAGPLQDLGLTQGQLALPLLGFNLGVELGQLVLVALLLPVAIALRRAPIYRHALVPGASAAVALLALVWVLERSLGWTLLAS
ncbi:HupE/UreJ family protein [Piscinibacter aquaticus]|uniref:HupE/UreJ family protein n=1 Tax=Piscinibacter aquaticus TaxID=392597 RepID=A0A5C6U5G9_9BURK|nr:HupE/UreJ family protein [Piscinibacter aquaticus]